MGHSKYTIATIYNPSNRLNQQANIEGIRPELLLRDWYSIGQVESDGSFSVAAGDMANNIVGTNIVDPELARDLELQDDFSFNGGLFASHSLRRWIATQSTSGQELVAGANEHLDGLYKKLGMNEITASDPATRFTGYFSHLKSEPDTTTFTSVGDVMVWVNGEHVAGIPEKRIDTAKDELIGTLTQLVWTAEVQDIDQAIYRFADEIGIDHEFIDELRAEIFSVRNRTAVQDRQAIYKPVDSLITPWQIRNLQNPERNAEDSPYNYGAIDGTKTPDGFIETVTIPTNDIHEIVMATDGLKPVSGQVRSLEDLVPANPEFGEQTAVQLKRR